MKKYNPNWLSSPLTQHSPQNYVAQILHQIQVTTLILLSIAIVSSLFWGYRITPLILLIGCMVVILTMLLAQRKQIQLATIMITISFLIIMNYLIYIGQGIHDEAIMAYPMIIVLSSLLLSKPLFIITTSLTILSLGFITWAELNDWIETGLDGITLPFDFVVTTLILIFTAVIMQRVIKILTTALEQSQKSAQRLHTQAQALKQSEARWRSFTESAPLIIVNTDLNGNINFINMQNPYPQQKPRTTIFDFLPPEEHTKVHHIFQKVINEKVTLTYESKGFGWRGEVAWYEAHIGPVLEDGQVTSLLFNIINVTERKATQMQLKHSEQRLRQFITQSSEAIWMIEYKPPISTELPAKQQAHLILQRGFIGECNDAGSQLYGFRNSSEAIGASTASLRANVDYETHYANTLSFIDNDYKFEQREFSHQLPSGKTVHLLTNSVGIIENGYLIGNWGTEQNITAIKEAENALRLYAKELERSNQELQEFAYIASHDLQEPLRKIQTFGDRLANKHASNLDGRALDYLNRMQDASKRMQQLIEALLAYSRVSTQTRPFSRVNLNDIVNTTLSDLEVRINELNATIHVSDLPEINGDDVQLTQLFQNLISNAIKFHQSNIPPVVHIRNGNTQNNNYIIEVEDNGIGFDEKYRDRIFNMFQRLNPRAKYEGTGVGLAVCRRIVERHGGKIDAHSQIGQGTTFTIRLPIKTEQEQEQ